MFAYGVENPIMAIENLTATTLRNIIGDLELDQTLTSRETINTKMRAALDVATDPWGIKVNRVELKNIIPPAAIQDAMEKQMKAERERRESILRAEGEKKSTILVAEGKKESAILEAEAEKEAAILRAEAQKEKMIREAEGEAEAILKVQKAEADGLRFIKEAGADNAVLQLKSLEAFAKAADGKATKIIIPSEIQGIAGLVKGASKGEGLGNQFLSNIREVDAIVHVVRCFDDPNVIHVDGSVDPVRDIETINLELIFSDIEILERRIAKQSKGAFNNKDLAKEVELLKAIKAHLEDGKLARSFEVEDEDDREFINSLNLLTWKPVIFAANVAEGDLADDGASNHYVQEVREYAKANDCEVFVICAEIEQEIAELDDDEKQMFLDDLGLKESGLEKLIAASYRILGLMSYLTAGPQESRAGTIKVGTKAPQAAGKIHSDFERGFIRAEVVSYDDLMACGSMNAAKEKGLVRSEGKEYVMKDGDVVLFRFNV